VPFGPGLVRSAALEPGAGAEGEEANVGGAEGAALEDVQKVSTRQDAPDAPDARCYAYGQPMALTILARFDSPLEVPDRAGAPEQGSPNSSDLFSL
jgi:hypothetical protein